MSLGSVIFVSITQALFANRLVRELTGLGIPNLDISKALSGGVLTITDGLSGEVKRAGTIAISDAIVGSWLLCVVLTCIAMIGALFVERTAIRGHTPKPKRVTPSP